MLKWAGNACCSTSCKRPGLFNLLGDCCKIRSLRALLLLSAEGVHHSRQTLERFLSVELPTHRGRIDVFGYARAAKNLVHFEIAANLMVPLPLDGVRVARWVWHEPLRHFAGKSFNCLCQHTHVVKVAENSLTSFAAYIVFSYYSHQPATGVR